MKYIDFNLSKAKDYLNKISDTDSEQFYLMAQVRELFGRKAAKEAIETDDYNRLYELSDDYASGFSLNLIITLILLVCGIDPLEGLTEVPDNCFDYLPKLGIITKITIPEYIRKLGHASLRGLKEVYYDGYKENFLHLLVSSPTKAKVEVSPIAGCSKIICKDGEFKVIEGMVVLE